MYESKGNSFFAEENEIFFFVQFRLVVKTSLKLLIVFAEYTETNALLILSAVTQEDRSNKRLLWSNAMKILNEMDNSASEVVLLIITLFNTVLSAIPDQDTFYDVTDALEKQGMQRCTQYYLSKKPSEPDLIEQFNIYDVSCNKAREREIVGDNGTCLFSGSVET